MFQGRLPPALVVLSKQNVHIILKVKTTQSQARKINTHHTPTVYPISRSLWEVTNLSTFCFSLPIFFFCKNNYTFAYFLISS